MNTEHAKLIGKKVRARRRELGLSQDELAKLIGYKGLAAISKIETGVSCIPTSKVNDFAKALQCDPGYLLILDNEERSNLDLGINASMKDVTLVSKYSKLNPQSQQIVMTLIDGLLKAQSIKTE